MGNNFYFDLGNKKIYIKYIYGSLTNINIDIENYLKRIENKKTNENLKIVAVPSYLVYSLEHLKWALFISEHKFEDEINVSRSFDKEVMLTLNLTTQLKRIKDLEPSRNNFICLVSEKKINKKDKEIIREGFREKNICSKVFNKKGISERFGLGTKNRERELIERMSFNFKR